jgi:uncharacterized protein (DUF2384 family)
MHMASSSHLRASRKPPRRIEAAAIAPAQDMIRYRALVSRTVDAFGDEIKAARWLSLPNRELSGQTPLQAVQNSGYDMQVLEPILTRIEHGVDY